MPEDLEKAKQEEYLGQLYKEIDIKNFLKKPITLKRAAQTKINIPPVEDKPVGGGALSKPPVGGATPPVGGLPPLPTAGGAGGGLPPLPAAGGTGGAGGGLPPLPAAGGSGGGLPPLPAGDAGGLPPLPGADKGLSKEEDKKLDDRMQKTIDQIQEKLSDVINKLQLSSMKDEILTTVKEQYKDLTNELHSLKDRKIPEREFFDTEGTYRDHLYSMATNMLDDFLPKLFDEIPEYSFIANQVSRTFEDGTVADALITLMAQVPKQGMRYDFKIDIPVLNGLMQYPLYIQRGQKIIPLTKPEIQKELESISYRKEEDDIIKNTNKKMFTNSGENINRREDKQKWYNVASNPQKAVGLPPKHIYSVQRGRGV